MESLIAGDSITLGAAPAVSVVRYAEPMVSGSQHALELVHRATIAN
jgi:hypothetical protein